MTDVPARGALAQLAMDPSTIDGSSQGFEFVSCGLKETETHVRSSGIRGSRSRNQGRVRIVQKRVGGQIIMEPTASELDFLLPYMLGGATSLGVTDVADTLTALNISLDAVSKVFTWSGCKIGKWVLSGSAGQPIRLALDIEGLSETVGNAGSYPAITLDETNFFVLADCSITLDSVSRKFRAFALTMDNLLDAGRYNNSLTRAQIASMDRMVQLTLDTPYTSDNTDLKDAAIAGAAGSLVIADGTDTYTFAFGNCKIPSDGPTVQGKSEIMMPITVDCYEDAGGTASECKVTKS